MILLLASLLTTALMVSSLTSSQTRNSFLNDEYSPEQIVKYLQDIRRFSSPRINPLRNWQNMEGVHSFVENNEEFEPNASVKMSKMLKRLISTLVDEDNQDNDPRVKRAYHALCHFKMCNMGSKRDEYRWWRKN